MSDKDLIGVFLYRSDLGDYPLYGEQRDIKRHTSWTIIGVATRPPNDAICSGGTRDRGGFIEEVEEKAVQWEWLDVEMET